MNFPTLIKNTMKVLPTAFKNSRSGMKVAKLVKNTFKGMRTIQFNSEIHSKGKKYKPTIAFRNQDGNVVGNTKRDDVVVRCTCMAYYFWFTWANLKAKCQFGSPAKPYQRKTPITDVRYPPKNPNHIPGVCKHLMLLFFSIEKQEKINATRESLEIVK